MSRRATDDLLQSARHTIAYAITIALGVLCAYGIMHVRW